MADHGNYLVATVHWWANNMVKGKEKKRKGKERKRKNRRKTKPVYVNRIATLLYSTFERVPVVFFCANLYWNGYANKDNYSYPLDGLPCNSRT